MSETATEAAAHSATPDSTEEPAAQQRHRRDEHEDEEEEEEEQSHRRGSGGARSINGNGAADVVPESDTVARQPNETSEKAAEAAPSSETASKTPYMRPYRRPEPTRVPFSVGFDLFTPEEDEKRRKRAAKYALPVYNPVAEQLHVDLETVKKLEERATKFGLPQLTPDSLMDVVELEDDRKDVQFEAARRWEAIHIYGVDKMSTADVLDYFDGYGAGHVEWINDSSCNVVFLDAPSAKRALICLSRPVPSELSVIESPSNASIPRSDLELMVWRVGVKARATGTNARSKGRDGRPVVVGGSGGRRGRGGSGSGVKLPLVFTSGGAVPPAVAALNATVATSDGGTSDTAATVDGSVSSAGGDGSDGATATAGGSSAVAAVSSSDQADSTEDLPLSELARQQVHPDEYPVLLRIASVEDVKLPYGQRKPSAWNELMRARAASIRSSNRQQRSPNVVKLVAAGVDLGMKISFATNEGMANGTIRRSKPSATTKSKGSAITIVNERVRDDSITQASAGSGAITIINDRAKDKNKRKTLQPHNRRDSNGDLPLTSSATTSSSSSSASSSALVADYDIDDEERARRQKRTMRFKGEDTHTAPVPTASAPASATDSTATTSDEGAAAETAGGAASYGTD